MTASSGRGDVIALMAGIVLPFAFAPFYLFPLAMLAPAVLFVVWQDVSPGRAAWRGFLFGLGMFSVGVSWIYVSLHEFGHMPAPLAIVAVFLFISVLSLFPALLGGSQALFQSMHPVWRSIGVLPALWVVFEWIRGWFLGGFPWLNLGYSQSDSWLIGYASWLGVYGVSFAVTVSAGLLVAAWFSARKFWIAYVSVGVLIWMGGWFAGTTLWVQPVNSPLQVALIQGDIALSDKWQPDQRQAIVERYVQLSDRTDGANLIIWPEAAVPGYLDQVGPELFPRLKEIGARQGADFLLGIIERDDNRRDYYNSVITVGSVTSAYRKQHLVPFGEFLPLPTLFGWLIDLLHIPMSNFSAGPVDQKPLLAAGQKLGISVCYEDAFGEEVIRMLPAATVLVNVSEDAWFGNSLAPHQRIQMARMRALESGRPLLRAANTGPSVIIDHNGQVQARAPQFEPFVLIGVVQPMQGVTPYVRFGNIPILVFVFFLVAVMLFITRRDVVSGRSNGG